MAGPTVIHGGGGDPLAVGQRIIAILETGLRVATYKLATLSALVDHCIEHLPADPQAGLQVPVPDLAERVLELYWPQVRPFDGVVLKQSSGSVARILRATLDLRTALGASVSGLTPPTARMRAPDRYVEAVDDIALTLARQPLYRLQRACVTHDPFLYDDSWLHDSLTRRQLQAHDSSIQLRPGIAYALARLSGLLKPTIEILWVDDVRRLNRTHFSEREDDLAGHLFGRTRISLAPARMALKEAFGEQCFYCDSRVARDNPVDHVLPWSRVGIDGLANLVLACPRCNGDKLHALPDPALIGRALERDHALLEEIASSIEWPTQRDRVLGAARGLYRGEPTGAVTWAGYKQTVRLDLAYAPEWLRIDPLLD
jgi:5-methylcytosine-specific restriction endonuclease McrA